jgi:hypothetical protein
MSKITGRKDDMLVIRGVNVYPSEVERVLLGRAALAPDYLLVVDEREPQSRWWHVASTERMAGPLPSGTELQGRLRDALGTPSAVRGPAAPGRQCRGPRSARRCGWRAGPAASRRCPA